MDGVHKMSDLIRKQLYITKQQDQLLKKKAATYNISEAEIVREALDSHTAAASYPRNVQEKWLEERRYIEENRKGSKNDSPIRRWKREDIYDR